MACMHLSLRPSPCRSEQAVEVITYLHVRLTKKSGLCSSMSMRPRRYLRWRTEITIAVCLASWAHAFHIVMPFMADALAGQPALADTRNGLANIGTWGLISTLLFFQVRCMRADVSFQISDLCARVSSVLSVCVPRAWASVRCNACRGTCALASRRRHLVCVFCHADPSCTANADLHAVCHRKSNLNRCRVDR